MTLWDVHTLPAAGAPVRHYQQYPDQSAALRMATHLVGVLGRELVVEQVDVPEPVGLLGREVAG